MHHSHRRARRVLAVLAMAGLAATASATLAPVSAGATSHPAVTARVRHRTLLVDGGPAADVIRMGSPAVAPNLVVLDAGGDDTADAIFDRSTFDTVVIRGRGGDDTVLIDETPVLTVPFTDTIPTSISGGHGNDTLRGGTGAEDFRGGSGNDVVDGNRGNDIASLDAGDDEFIWDPGDGSDTIEGRRGLDTMTFNGNGAPEAFGAVADGARLRFTRDVGNIVMDTNGIEQVDVNTLGGTDVTRIGDLAATDVTAVNVDGGGVLGLPGADLAVDEILVDGTEYADQIVVSGSLGSVSIAGVAAAITLSDPDLTDTLRISSLGGDDLVDATALANDTMLLDVQTADGDDVVRGGAGNDAVTTGSGHDVVDGNRGADTATLDEGDDEFIWDPGDGDDIIEGGDGLDTMTFNGAAAAEVFAATAIGERLSFTRDLGNIVMDTDDVEHVVLNALGGIDALTVNDLTGTDVSALGVDLGVTIGASGGDGADDVVTVVGTPGDDAVAVSSDAGAVLVDGLRTRCVGIIDNDPADTLAIVGNGGTDTVDSAGLVPGSIVLTVG